MYVVDLIMMMLLLCYLNNLILIVNLKIIDIDLMAMGFGLLLL